MPDSSEITIICRYRKSNSYGHHAVIAALETEPPDGSYKLVLARDYQQLRDSISSAVESGTKVLVAWSSYSPDFPAIAQELAQVKLETPGAPRVLHILGGVHATAEPLGALQFGFDLVAVGEGEATFSALVEAMATGGDPKSVPGIAWLTSDGEFKRAKSAVRRELDHYRSFPWNHRLSNPIEITRGCVYACKFCQTPFMFKAVFRHRSIDNVRQHVRVLRERQLTDVRFITPTSLSYGSTDESVNIAAIEELLSGVRGELGEDGRIFFGSFPSEVRPEHVDHDIMRMLKRYVANDNLIIGAQSGSSRVLQQSHRGHDVESIRRAVEICVAEGFQPNVDFIFGMPGEKREDALASVELAEQLAAMGARIHGHTFMPLPGTPWRDAPPGEISAEILKGLRKLISSGDLYGQWQKQQGIAADLASSRQQLLLSGGAHGRRLTPVDLEGSSS